MVKFMFKNYTLEKSLRLKKIFLYATIGSAFMGGLLQSDLFVLLFLIFIFLFFKIRKSIIKYNKLNSFTSAKNTVDSLTDVPKEDSHCLPVDKNNIQPPVETKIPTDNVMPSYIKYEYLEPEIKTTQKLYKVAGTSFRQEDIISISDLNDIYSYTKKMLIDNDFVDEAIYEYELESKNVSLIPEPDNKYDSNAVKVVILDTLVGYIQKKDAPKIKELLASNSIREIYASSAGGNCKYIFEEWDDEKCKYVYNLKKSKLTIGIDLLITTKI